MPDNTESQGNAGLVGEKVIEKNENSLTLEFLIPETSSYFDGHFPNFPILPAVAQTELVIRFASQYLGTGIDVSEIPRIKFSNLVWPSTPLVLKLEKNEKTVSFKIVSPDGNAVYSIGTLKFRESDSPKESGFPKESS